jgi:SH3 domain protein
MMLRTSIIALALSFAATAAGETLYVTDVLRLGLHAAADTSDRPFESLVSGEPLEILERTPSYARVRTAAGAEGWVKSNYLVAEIPARTRVAALEQELAAAREELRAAQAARPPAAVPVERPNEVAHAALGQRDAFEDTLARLKRDNASYEARLESYRGSLPLGLVGAALILALATGFVAGLWWLDALIRRRHGGFRVY